MWRYGVLFASKKYRRAISFEVAASRQLSGYARSLKGVSGDGVRLSGGTSQAVHPRPSRFDVLTVYSRGSPSWSHDGYRSVDKVSTSQHRHGLQKKGTAKYHRGQT